jgi:type II secretory pathway predicted ATPase ExeA
MYENFYGLERRPFTLSPDPDFLFWSDHHQLAFATLRYGLLTRAPIMVMTGEVGAGKTTLLRQLLREIDDHLVVGLVSNMQPGRGELLHWMMGSLGLPVDDRPYVALFQRFQDFIVETYAAGRRVLLVVDEAQNLSVEQLEELRMFSNINSDKDELLQLVLIGQPELRRTLALPQLRQFTQRIGADFHIETLSQQQTLDYIDHRLAVAGARWRIFPQQTGRLIHAATRGVPRLVNTLCDLCLVYGYAAEAKVVDEALLREFLHAAQQRGLYGQFAPLDGVPKLVTQTQP